MGVKLNRSAVSTPGSMGHPDGGPKQHLKPAIYSSAPPPANPPKLRESAPEEEPEDGDDEGDDEESDRAVKLG